MNGMDLLICLIIGILCALILGHLIRDKIRGRGCSCGPSACSSCGSNGMCHALQEWKEQRG